MPDQPAAIREILEAVDADLRAALAVQAIYAPASYEQAVIGKFDQTYAAHAFGLIRDQLILSAVAALARVWDQDADARSIPSLARHLAGQDVVDVIIAERRGIQLRLPEAEPVATQIREDETQRKIVQRMAAGEADRIEQEIRGGVARLTTRVGLFLEGAGARSLKDFRDRVIAHSLQETRAQRAATKRGKAIEPLKIIDLETLLRETVEIATELNKLLRGHDPSHDDFSEVWGRYAADFWNSVSPNQRRKPARKPAMPPVTGC